ncbi:dynamin family protein [Paenibacillus sp. 1A_MP2]|uniref:dynamin family protein n=1 Tax=Paenibacillus sp. 1A_MP2 TaxID=3457495 RepID=UPI003FCDBC02
MSRTDYPVEMAKPLLPLREAMEQTGDHTAVQALTDLISKAEMKQLTIAFCGHFSAGKSSLINSLCGKRVLPSSPVPTSANVVSIRNGEPRALIYTSSNVSADNTGEFLRFLQNNWKSIARMVGHTPPLKYGMIFPY